MIYNIYIAQLVCKNSHSPCAHARGLRFHSSDFVAALQGRKGTSVLVSKDDYSPLLKALAKLDHGFCITYKVPEVKVMANALCSKLGYDFGSPSELAEELMSMRNLFEGFKEEMKLGTAASWSLC